jgi:hypothetical protein
MSKAPDSLSGGGTICLLQCIECLRGLHGQDSAIDGRSVWVARERANRVCHSTASSGSALQQPPHPLSHRGGNSNGCERPGTAGASRRGSRPPVRATKTGHGQESRRPCAVTAAFVAAVLRALTPDHASF